MSSAVDFPRQVTGVVRACAVDQDVLHVPPSQVLVGFENQCNDSGGKGGGAGGAAEVMRHVAAVVAARACDVGGGYSLVVSVRVCGD